MQSSETSMCRVSLLNKLPRFSKHRCVCACSTIFIKTLQGWQTLLKHRHRRMCTVNCGGHQHYRGPAHVISATNTKEKKKTCATLSCEMRKAKSRDQLPHPPAPRPPPSPPSASSSSWLAAKKRSHVPASSEPVPKPSPREKISTKSHVPALGKTVSKPSPREKN